MRHKTGRKAIKGFLVFGRSLSVIYQHVILIHVAEQIPIRDLKPYKELNLIFITFKNKTKVL